MVRRVVALIVLIGLALGSAWPLASMGAQPTAVSSYCFDRELDDGRPRPICIGIATYTADVCTAIARDSRIFGLPPDYFARLVWQESHFDPNAMSGAGAEGIAQFMPSTGRLQGMRNAYDPAEALWRSARYLSFLRGKFGNLGLAAAAYNGGENGVTRFVAGTGYLAAETLNYVEIITGIPVTDWLAGDVPTATYDLQPGKPFQQACIDLAKSNTLQAFTPPTAIVRPWGIQLAQFFSQATARRSFERLQRRFPLLAEEELMLVVKRNPNFGRRLRYTVEIGRDSRADAAKLCAAVQKAGGACLTVRN